MPLPSEETTPPVMKMKRVSPCAIAVSLGVQVCARFNGTRSSRARQAAAALARPGSAARNSPRSRRPAAARGRARAARAVARSVGAEHPHQLADHPVAVERRDRGRRRAPAASLTIVKWRSASAATCGRWVMQRSCRPCASVAQVLADRARGVPADAGVDLVEHEQRPPARAGRARLRDAQQREHHPRELAAGGDLAQRRRRSRRRWGRSESRSRRLRAGRSRPAARRSSTSNRASGIASSASRSRTAAASFGARACDGRRRGASPADRARRTTSASSPRGVLERLVGVLELVAARAAALGVGEHVGDRAAVLARQPREHREPLLDLLEPRLRAALAAAICSR